MKSLEGSVAGKMLCAFVGTAFLLVAAAWSEERVSVRYLCNGEKVIPVVCSIGNWRITDIKLPDLVLTNNGGTALDVECAEILGFVSGTEAVRVRISGGELREAIRNTAGWLGDPNTPLPAVQLSFGEVALPEGAIAEGTGVDAGKSAVLPFSKISYLHHVGQSALDGMEIRLTMNVEPGRKKTLVFPVQLVFYRSRGDYLFPLKGDLRIAYTPLSYIHHRASGSQEFGMDIVAAVQKGAASFTDISLPEPKQLSDYGIWGRDVLAIGDGIVAGIGDKFPEERMCDPALFAKPGYTSGLLKELLPAIGWTNAVAGNYVIIDHRNGEFSMYAHLQEGSILVKARESVKKGQVVGKVGNTGNSGAPHLHFQLMDSADFFTANGLPVMFGNVPEDAIISEYPVEANCLAFSDSIYGSVP
ncbi:MAG: M23 family metallopeptidase [Aminobacteriaceae bacterium]|uniref:M23 family metallopeptidase n=1 Tax=Aminivibrio sp. TaxID=1872489 RepID=UPI002B2143E6|nr:M23 family metallopeptidase [Aminivibrio sp.]MEA4951683.1 M23 family metallopeptidase [Aminivibrio sp.]